MEYETEAKQRYGHTAAWQEYEQKRAETAAYLTDAGFTDTLPPVTADILHKIDHWEYYRLKN